MLKYAPLHINQPEGGLLEGQGSGVPAGQAALIAFLIELAIVLRTEFSVWAIDTDSSY